MRTPVVTLSVTQILRRLRASYWFVPSLMLVLAIALGALMVWLDAGPAATLLDGVSWYQKSKPEGAREVLSTIAGSMITVAGVVFSITIVAISFAAGQYGPRILTNFMSDRGNQVTLGTFVATFTYAVVVLRTIHAGDSNFVPQLAVGVGMLLAVCSIAVMIYFIHHVPESIHVDSIAARVGRQLLSRIDSDEPDPEPPEPGALKEAEEIDRSSFVADCARIHANGNGYVQALDESGLVALAAKHGLVVRLVESTGSFVYEGQPLAVVVPGEAAGEDFREAASRKWSLGSRRTPDCDELFLIDELVEIAARALSAGVNDPHTANTSVDWLTAALATIAGRPAPTRFRFDDHGKLRVIATAADFETHLARAFGQLRPYLAGDVNSALYALKRLASLATSCRSAEQRNNVTGEIRALTELAETLHQGPSRRAVAERGAQAGFAITGA